MRLVLRDKAPAITPEMEHDYGIVFEKDLRMHKRGKLRMKLLVFEEEKGMAKFFSGLQGSPSTYQELLQVHGMVRSFLSEHYPDDGRPQYVTADSTYFCWMGLVKGRCTLEIITHESVHASCAYERRAQRNTFGDVGEEHEERIAYGTGYLAHYVAKALFQGGIISGF